MYNIILKMRVTVTQQKTTYNAMFFVREMHLKYSKKFSFQLKLEN